MRKPEEVVTSSPAGYHFTHETETQVQIVAVDRPVSAELFQHAAQTLGLLYERQYPLEVVGPVSTDALGKTYISIIFAKTERFELLRAFL